MELLSLPDDELIDLLAYDIHLQQRFDALVTRLAEPGGGRDSMLTPEAWAVLAALRP
jgi:hypothetical protein